MIVQAPEFALPEGQFRYTIPENSPTFKQQASEYTGENKTPSAPTLEVNSMKSNGYTSNQSGYSPTVTPPPQDNSPLLFVIAAFMAWRFL